MGIHLHNSLPGLLLLLTLSNGCKKAEPVLADFTTDLTEAVTGDSIQFLNASRNASRYQWDFGDGASSFRENPTHAYDQPGTFEVTLTSIGEGGSDEASLEIEVIEPYQVTIFEGVGIDGAFIGDRWSSIRSLFTSDTIYLREYLTDLEAYFHMAYYYNEGIALVFVNGDTLIGQEDPLRFIYLVAPYAGATTKGVSLGSTMERVVKVYGQPEEVSEGTSTKSYWYDSKGVDFLTYLTGNVDEIDVYPISTAKSASTEWGAVGYLMPAREKFPTFRSLFPENLD